MLIQLLLSKRIIKSHGLPFTAQNSGEMTLHISFHLSKVECYNLKLLKVKTSEQFFYFHLIWMWSFKCCFRSKSHTVTFSDPFWKWQFNEHDKTFRRYFTSEFRSKPSDNDLYLFFLKVGIQWTWKHFQLSLYRCF